MKAEFSRPLRAETVSPGQAIEVTANEGERAALAARLDVPAVHELQCRFVLRPEFGGRVRAEGSLRARVDRICVVTLETFTAEIAEQFVLRFVPEALASEDFDPDEEEDEVPFAGGVIDLGETTAEQLALALDPYPRMPGVAWPEGDSEEGPADPDPRTPFARLAAVRRKE